MLFFIKDEGYLLIHDRSYLSEPRWVPCLAVGALFMCSPLPFKQPESATVITNNLVFGKPLVLWSMFVLKHSET